MRELQTWRFGIQFLFSTVMIGLCTFQLVNDKTKENQTLYWSGLSTVLAYWLPSPSSTQEENFSQPKANQEERQS
ncbi:MAG: hypothetical protein KME28_03685 [Pelatocladus maniniholoensis HA4357-MV3]|jgi:hypothetical protein|uniref:Uncharacterized protein n=1 Tax=Pelatocladus maniniholoensis HA4357-MV3 TaxID=1117104 RepID=A0A9E3LR81_9NOST|nr:hypothetical protein [Pelatocladus maniniholoensis HA4357-MV3]BAZ70149.1 hypothetical protein NIES4106_49360 [Fischerella sp. NIES-4106]